MAQRVVADCRKFPSEKKCTLTVAGKMEEIVPVAAWHAVKAHGHKDSQKLRKEIRAMFNPA